MLKFIKQSLVASDYIYIYPVISLIIFSSFFIGVIYYVYKMSKNSIDEHKNIPLDK